jgi:hypothetical protein
MLEPVTSSVWMADNTQGRKPFGPEQIRPFGTRIDSADLTSPPAAANEELMASCLKDEPALLDRVLAVADGDGRASALTVRRRRASGGHLCPAGRAAWYGGLPQRCRLDILRSDPRRVRDAMSP